eukprot:3108269-Pleurochrysis_carterae.AAC.1
MSHASASTRVRAQPRPLTHGSGKEDGRGWGGRDGVWKTNGWERRARAPFAGDLVVERAEGDPKGLQRAERRLVVHGEGVLADAAKLHEDGLGVLGRIVELEVLDRGARDAAVEVEHVGAHLLVPLGRLVLEDLHVLFVHGALVPLEHRLLGILRPQHLALAALVHVGHHHLHLARPARAEHVLLVEDARELLPHLHKRVVARLVALELVWVGPLVVERKLGADEVGAQLAEKVAALPIEVVLVERDEVVGRLVLLALARREEQPVALLEVDLVRGEEARHAALFPLDVALHHRADGARSAHARHRRSA